jgi:hypothetical protein
MTRRILGVIIAAAALAACGAPADNTAAGEQFKAQFDKGTHDSCVKAATGKGAAADKAESYCACVVDQANQLSNQDKMTLAMNPDKMKAMAEACASKLTN